MLGNKRVIIWVGGFLFLLVLLTLFYLENLVWFKDFVDKFFVKIEKRYEEWQLERKFKQVSEKFVVINSFSDQNEVDLSNEKILDLVLHKKCDVVVKNYLKRNVKSVYNLYSYKIQDCWKKGNFYIIKWIYKAVEDSQLSWDNILCSFKGVNYFLKTGDINICVYKTFDGSIFKCNFKFVKLLRDNFYILQFDNDFENVYYLTSSNYGYNWLVKVSHLRKKFNNSKIGLNDINDFLSYADIAWKHLEKVSIYKSWSVYEIWIEFKGSPGGEIIKFDTKNLKIIDEKFVKYIACDKKTGKCYDDFADKIKSLTVENLIFTWVVKWIFRNWTIVSGYVVLAKALSWYYQITWDLNTWVNFSFPIKAVRKSEFGNVIVHLIWKNWVDYSKDFTLQWLFLVKDLKNWFYKVLCSSCKTIDLMYTNDKIKVGDRKNWLVYYNLPDNAKLHFYLSWDLRIIGITYSWNNIWEIIYRNKNGGLEKKEKASYIKCLSNWYCYDEFRQIVKNIEIKKDYFSWQIIWKLYPWKIKKVVITPITNKGCKIDTWSYQLKKFKPWDEEFKYKFSLKFKNICPNGWTFKIDLIWFDWKVYSTKVDVNWPFVDEKYKKISFVKFEKLKCISKYQYPDPDEGECYKRVLWYFDIGYKKLYLIKLIEEFPGGRWEGKLYLSGNNNEDFSDLTDFVLNYYFDLNKYKWIFEVSSDKDIDIKFYDPNIYFPVKCCLTWDFIVYKDKNFWKIYAISRDKKYLLPLDFVWNLINVTQLKINSKIFLSVEGDIVNSYEVEYWLWNIWKIWKNCSIYEEGNTACMYVDASCVIKNSNLNYWIFSWYIVRVNFSSSETQVKFDNWQDWWNYTIWLGYDDLGRCFITANLSKSELKKVWEWAWYPVYELKDPNHPILKEFYCDRLYYDWKDELKNTIKCKIDDKRYKNFIQSHPILFWKDPFGRYIRMVKMEYMPQAEKAKPVIYLYPTKKQKVFVKIWLNWKFLKTIPEYSSWWKVTAYPDGKIIVGGKIYPYLYRDGIDYNYIPPSRWFVVENKKEKIKQLLENVLKQVWLNDKEIEDFTEYWLSYLTKIKEPYIFIWFKFNDSLNRETPLYIDPKPDTIIRIFMDYRWLDKKIKVKQPILKKTERRWFVVVEWGGRRR